VVVQWSCSFMKRSESGKTEEGIKSFVKDCLPHESFVKEEVRWKFDAVNRIGVVELPTGSKRVGLSSLTLQSEWRSHAAKSMRWWAGTVVVLAGRRCPQQQAT